MAIQVMAHCYDYEEGEQVVMCIFFEDLHAPSDGDYDSMLDFENKLLIAIENELSFLIVLTYNWTYASPVTEGVY